MCGFGRINTSEKEEKLKTTICFDPNKTDYFLLMTEEPPGINIFRDSELKSDISSENSQVRFDEV